MHWTTKLAAAVLAGVTAACVDTDPDIAAVPVVIERQPVVSAPQVLTPPTYSREYSRTETITGPEWEIPPDADSYSYSRTVRERRY